MRGFTIGWFPTMAGYAKQGAGKFGFYELFKDVYRNLAGSPENQRKYQYIGFIVSAALAEMSADLMLCPWEALKIKMQTSEPGTFPIRTLEGFNQLNA